MSVQIRLAREEDAEAISGLIRPLTARHIAHEFSPAGARHLLNSMAPESILGYIRGGFRYHVAEERETVAGVVATRDNAHLYHLFVAEPFQGRGLGKSLWEEARQACLEAGGTGTFTVNSSRLAVGFYRRLGFVETGPCVTFDGVTCVPLRISRDDVSHGHGQPD